MVKVICEICRKEIDTEAYPRRVVNGFGQPLEPVEYYCENCFDFEKRKIKIPKKEVRREK